MDDLISRQAAIDCVNHMRFGMDKMAFGIVTTALLELPSAQPEITNEEIEEIRFALKQLGAYFSIKIRDKKEGDAPVELLQRIEEIQKYVSNLPSAQPKHGRWTVTPLYIACSECGASFFLVPQNYCPNCGLRMDGKEE